MVDDSVQTKTSNQPCKLTSCCALIQVEGPDANELRTLNRPFFETTHARKSRFSSSAFVFHECDIYIYLVTSAVLITPFIDHRTSTILSGTTVTVIFNTARKEYKCELVGLAKNETVDKYIDQLLYQQYGDLYWGWSAEHCLNSSNTHDSPSNCAVFRIEKNEISSKQLTCIQSVPFFTGEIYQTQSIYVIGSPFGLLSPQTFINSVTKGIVSGIISDSKANSLAFFTDARMLPGTEGGLVCCKSSLSCIGICTLPIRSKSGAIDLNLVISINSMRSELYSLIGLPNRHSKAPSSSLLRIISPLDNAKKSVALINVKDSWSAGIMINHSGLILTNAHLIAPYTNNGVLHHSASIIVQLDTDMRDLNKNHTYYNASLVFLNTVGPLDVALIQIEGQFHSENFVKINSQECYKQGEAVFAIGYPLFHPTSTNATIRSSTITEGILSKIVKHQKEAVLLQTTALIHKGNSGGGIFNGNGKLIGLVTSNAKQNMRGSTATRLIPSLNFAIPVAQLASIASYAIDPTSESLSVLNSNLNSPNAAISDIWRLTKRKAGKKKSAFESFMNKMHENNENFINSKL